MNKFKLTMLMLLISFSGAFAQQTITGHVTSKKTGETLPGVSISVKGTSIGTTTDINGSYSITMPSSDSLIFSSVGYTPQSFFVTSSGVINVEMEESLIALEEVTVIGYGSVRKKDLTGAVTQISSKDIEQRNVASLTEALAGTMAGVQVSSYSGAPGSSSFVSIRGISTINDNGVLWVVDGMPLKSIDYLNPQDIESVHVLKDASAAAIYGSQAANGVIIIETKKGKIGQTQVTYNQRYGIQSIIKNPSLAGAKEYAQIQNQGVLNDNGSSLPFSDIQSMGQGTDWWGEVTQVAPTQDYYLGITKGGEEYNVSTSISYLDQEGVLKGGGYNRLTLRLNTDFKLGKNFKIGENFTFSDQKTKNGLDDYMVWDAMRLEPVTPVYLPDYEITDQNEYSIFSPTITDVGNLGGQLARQYDDSRSFRTVGNLFLEYMPFENFMFKSELGVEIENWERRIFNPTYYIEENDKNDVNDVDVTFGHKYLYNWNNILSYKKSFGDHDLNVMGAITLRSDVWDTVQGKGKNTPSNHETLRYLEATTSGWEADSDNTKVTYFSYLGRLIYDYKDKYLLSASIRRDGSSKFPESNKWGTFPSISVGWVLTEEGLLNSVDWLDFLKIRAAWGQIGNDNLRYEAQFSTIDNYYYVLGQGQSVMLGKAPSQIGNNALIWETVEDMNIGLDATFLKDKLKFSFDYFDRKTSNMIMEKQLLSYMGAGYGTQWVNIGSMSITGYEFELIYRNNISDFRYNIGFNLSHSEAVMDELADGNVIWDGNDQRLGMLTYTAEGGQVGAFYGYVTNGIFQSLSDVNNYSDDTGNLIQPNAKPGDFKFKDLNGDGRITDADRKVIGSPEPLFTFGLNFSANYKGFDLRVLLTGSYGNEILTPIWAYTNSGSGNYNSYEGLIGDAWNGEGSSNTQPRITNYDQNQNFRYSDYYISDGSYLRVKNIQIGYELPEKWVSKIKVDKLRIYASCENLFTFTNYEGFDPDIGPYYNNILLRGVDWGNYPLPRIISFGLNLSF